MKLGLPLMGALTAGCLLFSAGCGGEPETQTATIPAASASRTFDVKGVVKGIDLEARRARIHHEAIPDYMAEMTMNLNVRDTNELTGLVPEDAITFRLNVTEDGHWIDRITKVATTTATEGTELPPPSSWRLIRTVEPLDVGDPMPNYTFTNELGRVISLADFKGQAYAFTFIFTRCPIPDFCPRMSSHFLDVQNALAQMPDAPENWRLFSITIDPEFDTPEVLKGYAARYKYDPERWSFVTGPLIDITAIGEQFGLEFFRPDGTINHNLRTVVVDAGGKVQNIIVGNAWKPGELVVNLVNAARVEPEVAAQP